MPISVRTARQSQHEGGRTGNGAAALRKGLNSFAEICSVRLPPAATCHDRQLGKRISAEKCVFHPPTDES